jgi:hypothetical protein
MTSQRCSRTMRTSAMALRSIVTGLLEATFIAMNCAPAAVMSATRRPPLETTIGRCPAAARMRTSCTAPASAAPACRLGTMTSTVSGIAFATAPADCPGARLELESVCSGRRISRTAEDCGITQRPNKSTAGRLVR